MKKITAYISTALLLPLLLFSCVKFLTVDPEDQIMEEEAYTKADNAIAAIYGLYSLIQPLVDQIYLCGEAQADLVVSARGADRWIAEIAQNRVTPDNPYTDYTNFYRLIVGCHQVETGLAKIRRSDPINYTQEKYELNLAEIACVRSWAYLQLVKIWKDVPWLDRDVTSIEQLHLEAPVSSDVILANIEQDVADNLGLMQKLRLPGTVSMADIIDSRSQFTAPSARFLLTEIYLYRNNLDQAWQTIRPLLPFGEVDPHVNRGISAGYQSRYWDQKIAGITDKEALWPEWCLFVDFDGSKGQTNSLQSWTKNKDGGIYALRPSTNAIHYFENTPMMLREYQIPKLYYDPRLAGNVVSDSEGYPIVGFTCDMTRGKNVSYRIDGQDTLIFKYTLKEYGVQRSATQNDAHSNDDAVFLLYRTLPFFQVTMEIVNNQGAPLQALRWLNGGDGGSHAQSPRHNAGCIPFRLDPAGGDEIMQVNRFILEDMVLESAFEGLRWFALVRFASRPGCESWLGELVAQKYPASQQAAIKTRLSDKNYWYFPYYRKNVDMNPNLTQKTGY